MAVTQPCHVQCQVRDHLDQRRTTSQNTESVRPAASSDPTAMTMPTYTVFPLESPLSPSQLAAYKMLRLTSLQMDPQAFGSNYAREVAFSEDVWRERLDPPFNQTFIAAVLPSHTSDPDVDNKEPGGTGKWIATASIVGPSGMLPPTMVPIKEAGVGVNLEIYALFAMWVHPAHRAKGVGTQLVKACLEWARTDVDIEFKSGNNPEKAVVLLVYDDNDAGRALYSRAGFSDLEGVLARKGERWMLARI